MAKNWTMNISEMEFTADEQRIVEKYLDNCDVMLSYDGVKCYKTEDPREDIYFNSKAELMESINYTINEWKKEGWFEDDEEQPTDKYLEILEQRVKDEEECVVNNRDKLQFELEKFRKYVSEARDVDIAYCIEDIAVVVTKARERHEESVRRMNEARKELSLYKETIGA